MTIFDWVIVSATFCGLLMVAGSLLLLYKGVIRISEAPKKDAISVEFRRVIRITSQYPALGLFIIGWVFIFTALFSAKPAIVQPITLHGHIEGVDPSSVKILVSSDTWATAELDSAGVVDKITYPDLQRIYVQIIAAGANPPIQKFLLEIPSNRILDLPKIVFNEVLKSPGEGKIINLPKDVKAPPLSEAKKF